MSSVIQHLVSGWMPVRGTEHRYETLCGNKPAAAVIVEEGEQRCVACMRKLYTTKGVSHG